MSNTNLFAINYGDTGANLYQIVTRKSDAKVFSSVGGGTWTTFANADIGDYDWTCAETPAGSYRYQLVMPDGIVAPGDYLISVFRRLGAAPTVSDLLLAVVEISWDGSAIEPAGLEAKSVAAPTAPAASLRGMLVQLWRRFFKKTVMEATAGAGTIKTYADDGATVVTTQAVVETATTQTQGTAE